MTRKSQSIREVISLNLNSSSGGKGIGYGGHDGIVPTAMTSAILAASLPSYTNRSTIIDSKPESGIANVTNEYVNGSQ